MQQGCLASQPGFSVLPERNRADLAHASSFYNGDPEPWNCHLPLGKPQKCGSNGDTRHRPKSKGNERKETCLLFPLQVKKLLILTKQHVTLLININPFLICYWYQSRFHR